MRATPGAAAVRGTSVDSPQQFTHVGAAILVAGDQLGPEGIDAREQCPSSSRQLTLDRGERFGHTLDPFEVVSVHAGKIVLGDHGVDQLGVAIRICWNPDTGGPCLGGVGDVPFIGQQRRQRRQQAAGFRLITLIQACPQDVEPALEEPTGVGDPLLGLLAGGACAAQLRGVEGVQTLQHVLSQQRLG
jgi:hypothetical protein